MTGPRWIDGARVPLFERLMAADWRGEADMYPPDRLAAAITTSLAALFEVRAPQSAHGKPAAARSVTDYGVAASEDFAAPNHEDRARFAAEALEAIRAFEPRLNDPAVEIIFDPSRSGALVASISGTMKLGEVYEPFSFLHRIAPADDAAEDGGGGDG